VTDADRRRAAVARLIRTRAIGTQEALLAALEAAGVHATQATLSRDLARLGARRASRPGGGTHYELGERAEADPLGALRGLVTTVTANASMVVVRTLPGSANAVARAVDVLALPEVLGTIAGDDTIFVARRLAARLAELLGVPGAREGGATRAG
jgi:transcriptional regulator of arginine metabolism